jgi:hypothetical protein
MTLNQRHPSGGRQRWLALLCAFLIGPADAFAYAALAGAPSPQAPAPAQAAGTATLVSAQQLDSLVAPIALYPDHLLAQVLAASTYPLELMQLQQWLGRNPNLKDKALADAVAQQPWDPSVQAMAGLPDVVKMLTENVQWTTDLGNAFLAQQGDVMSAVQRMRQSAQAKGALQSNQQQVVQTQTVDGTQAIVIEQANPQVIYVPQYTPAAIWGTPVYPWPSVSYPWGWGALSFGAGIAMGAFWGGGWGWNTGWGRGNLTVNNFNNFNRANINRNGNFNRNGNWQHNAAHRGGTPYSNRATANRFGGTTRGDSLANRQAGARQQLNRQGGQVGTGGLGNRGAGNVGNRGNLGNRGSSGIGGGGQGIGNRPGGGLGNRGTSGIGGGNIGNRPGAGSGLNRPTQLPSGSGNRAGSRDFSRSAGSGAFGGGSRGFNGAGANRDFNRGSSSFGSRGGGGFNRGGGGFNRGGGGMSRGGGGFSRGGGGGGRRGGGGGRGRR